MIVNKTEKLHIIYRSNYEKSTRRHFLGEVMEVQGSVCRLEGYVFVYDERKTEFIKKPEKRITIINLAESGYITNIIHPEVILENVRYKYEKGLGLIATDGKLFTLDINEFGVRS